MSGLRNMLLEPRFVRISHVLTIVVPLAWWSICYAIWVHKGCRAFLPFISEFDMWEPEDTIFTVGVSLTAVLLLIRMLQLYFAQRPRIRRFELGRKWSVLHELTLVPGTLGVCCAAGLAFVPWNDNLPLHVALADCIFYSGVTWCIAATSLTWRLSKIVPALTKGLRWRIRGSVVAAVSLIGMINTVGPVLHDPEYDRMGRVLFSKTSPMEYCTERYSNLLDYGAAFEWLLVMSIFFVTWTFVSELRSDTDISES